VFTGRAGDKLGSLSCDGWKQAGPSGGGGGGAEFEVIGTFVGQTRSGGGVGPFEEEAIEGGEALGRWRLVVDDTLEEGSEGLAEGEGVGEEVSGGWLGGEAFSVVGG
jgi:hypothetical protein